MSEVDDCCRLVVESFGGDSACGLVDVASGAMVAAHASDRLRHALVDLAALASGQLVRGADMATIDQAIRAHFAVPESDASAEQEFYVAAGDLAWFARSMRRRTSALLVVTERTANIGLCWSLVRNAVPSFEALLR